MAKSLYGLALAAAITLGYGPLVLAAEGEPGWALELEPMYLWLTEGEGSYSPATETRRVFNGTTFGPFTNVRTLQTDFDDEEFTFRGELQRRREDKWGYGIMGWWFETNTSTVTAMPEGNSRGTFFSSPGDFEAGIFVPSMQSLPNPISPTLGGGQFIDNVFNELSFMADAEFDLWKVDIHGMREIGEYKPEKTLDFLFGLELVEINMARREVVRNVAPAPADPTIIDNITVLEAGGDTEYGIAFGPMFGLQYERRHDRHRFKGLLTQSFVFADQDSRAGITQTLQQTPTGGSVQTLSTTVVGMDEGDDLHTLPITEAKLAYHYDVTKKTSLGLGGFLSVWWDAPLAPTFNKSESDTLVFVGVFLSGQIRFD